ncbi:N2227-like protein [Lasiodiplodia theobromae]|uniref:Methyltransferase family n=1 Tax=Lasiodiplodia theobromae TaxID=45133 RepID=UPI0015C40A74|nr:Methyltransferase family [Lasiodiplodia theobromae]KAF4545296.1 Methyltransferase family [Lasiodiplodia theobromae]KAF9639037.1 N2227-like protein [Lasiodiplodia theobromae]
MTSETHSVALEGEWQGELDPEDDLEEQRVIYATLDSFQSYRRVAHYNVTHVRRQNFYAMPSAHWNLLAGPPFNILDVFDRVDDAIDANADLAEAIFRAGAPNFGVNPAITSPIRDPDDPSRTIAPVWRGAAAASDLEKARSTIRQMYRDWSAAGASERAACYGPVLRALSAEHASTPPTDRDELRVLVPGAGLGRLVLEVCRLGFSVEGNEISYHQLLASSFILNHSAQAEQFAVYPWAHAFSNHRDREAQLRSVRVPDVHPATALTEASAGCRVHAFERMGMAAADFCVSYKGEEARDSFDAVATVFFIDTAPNLINYIEAIANCLKAGGLWINLGPLLWHFENDPPGAKNKRGGGDGGNDEGDASGAGGAGSKDLGIAENGSVELTDEEVVALVERFGFKIEQRELPGGGEEGVGTGIETGYISDPKSMMQHVYKPSFWVARKL